jgi:hypothetical protein
MSLPSRSIQHVLTMVYVLNDQNLPILLALLIAVQICVKSFPGVLV